MAASKWMFTKEQLQNTPSRKSGIDADKELSYRQQAANLIQDMGQRLQVTQLCINTAIVFMHRFYMFRSFSRFPRNDMAPACLFLAAKVEEQPRKLEHVIKVAHSCLHRDNTPAPDTKTEAYLEQAQQLVINENILLQTLGFEVKVDHPHTHVVKATKLVNASKDLSQTSYYLATNSLHLTTFCLQYRPTVVACCCIYLACKWAKYMIPRSNEGREWYQYVDPNVTSQCIEELYNEFISILNKCPTKLKKLKMCTKAGDGPRDDHGKSDLGLPMEANHTSSPTVHNRHTNHERRERERDSKHSQSEQKQSHDHRDGKPEHHRDLHLDRRKESYQQHPDRKALNPHHQDPKLIRKDDRRETHPSSQPQRKDAQHYSEQRERPSHHENHKRDTVEVKKENDLNGRSHSSSSATSQSRSHTDLVKLEPNRESPTARLESAPGSGSQSSTPGGTPDLPRKIKQETSAINIQEYMKRKKEKEHQEREKREREREIIEKERRERERLEKELAKLEMERQKDKRSKKVETDSLNKTFSEGSSKEQKHRPPKLDVSLPLLETKSNNKERPYEVNIKSPIKPHHNITVKSPIKSSDLKQPKLEIPKVLITPEKDGSDPFSVNINNDPAIRKLMIKQEPQSSDNESDSGNLTHVKSRQNLSSASESVSKSMIKIKQELEPGEIDDEEPEINLLPEHVAAPSVKIRELGYDPEKGLESAVALKHAMKQEHGSGRSTPVVSQSGSGSNTPLRVKLPVPGLGESSPLKIKISTKGLSTDSDHSSGKHSSPHGHKHKHKEKHKSHKHKDRHKDKHREKHSSSSSAVGTNGQSLKMSIKLSDINKHSGSGSESFSVKNKQEKQKHRLSVSDPSLTKSATLSEADRQQPWSVSALISKSGATAGINENSQESRKRRRTPTVDQNAEQPSQSKAQKMGSQRLRRSSSSHSVVSMEMSDGEDGHTNGPHIQTGANAPPQLSQLHQSLNQLISQTQKQVENMRQNQAAGRPSPGESRQPRQQRLVDRQQSGFDLEGMMWAGNSGDLPPLPTDHLAPPPPLPPSHVAPPPPPSH